MGCGSWTPCRASHSDMRLKYLCHYHPCVPLSCHQQQLTFPENSSGLDHELSASVCFFFFSFSPASVWRVLNAELGVGCVSFLPPSVQLVLCWGTEWKWKPRAILISRGKHMNLCPSTQVPQVGGVPIQIAGGPKHSQEWEQCPRLAWCASIDWC